MTARLVALPVELLTIILCSLHSPLALYHTIVASSACYRVFAQSRTDILTQVLGNAMGEAAPQALGAFYASVMPDSHKLSKAQHRREVKVFLHRLHNRSLGFPNDYRGLVQLSRSWLRVDAFISDYSNRALALLHSKEPFRLSTRASSDLELQGRGQVPLSATEYTRLQRAFFRFDIYCSCFQADWEGSEGYDANFTDTEQCRLFLEPLHEWEIEELCSVHQYLTELANLLVNALEDAFVNAVMRASKSAKHSFNTSPKDNFNDGVPTEDVDIQRQSQLGKPTAIDSPAAVQSETREVKDLELDGLDLFSTAQKSCFESFLSRLCSDGTLFVQRLLRGDENSRRLQIIQNYRPVRHFFREALRRLDMKTHEPPKDSVTQEKEVTSSYNMGWFLTQGKVGKSWLRVDSRFSLRDAGYIFWDASRFADISLENRTYTYNERKTAEERLRGVRIGKNVFNEIVLEYGGSL